MIAHPAYEWIKSGDQDQVRAWFTKNPDDLNAAIAEGYTPIQIAAMHGQVALVEYFLGRMVLANKIAENPSKTTTLHLAVAHRVLENVRPMIRILVENGAELGAQDANGETPLHHAAARAELVLVKDLIELGADPFMKDHQGLTVGALIDKLPETVATTELKLAMREELKGAFSLPLE